VELISTALMSALPPLVLGVHPMVNWLWLFVSIFISVDAHSGFDFPWGLQNFVPCYGGPVTHDMHHQRPNTNYQPFFTYLDFIFNTAAPKDAYNHLKTQ
jgi:sterol desaturase/sphingolipid hydroxylase (fatty acid hydroxylase superfamily)